MGKWRPKAAKSVWSHGILSSAFSSQAQEATQEAGVGQKPEKSFTRSIAGGTGASGQAPAWACGASLCLPSRGEAGGGQGQSKDQGAAAAWSQVVAQEVGTSDWILEPLTKQSQQGLLMDVTGGGGKRRGRRGLGFWSELRADGGPADGSGHMGSRHGGRLGGTEW